MNLCTVQWIDLYLSTVPCISPIPIDVLLHIDPLYQAVSNHAVSVCCPSAVYRVRVYAVWAMSAWLLCCMCLGCCGLSTGWSCSGMGYLTTGYLGTWDPIYYLLTTGLTGLVPI